MTGTFPNPVPTTQPRRTVFPDSTLILVGGMEVLNLVDTADSDQASSA